MSRVATLRASGRKLTADVVLGLADNGTQVTVNVVLDRTAGGDLDEAMVPLENLLKRVAEERTGQAKNNAAIQAGINERLPKEVKREKERLARNVEHEVEKRVQHAQREVTEAASARRQAEARLRQAEGDFQQHVDSLRRQLEEARQTVDRLQSEAVAG